MADSVDGTMRSLLRLPAGDSFDLASIDPRATPGLPKKGRAKRDPKAWTAGELDGAFGAALAEEQEKLYASAKTTGDRRRVLVVLQAMDCGGKDGTVHHVMGRLNPQGLHIRSFGAPTEEELKHDFLWRIRRALPEPGYLGVFNRSHYEDVLIARVHDLVPEDVWRERYDKINDFEYELVDAGYTLLKIMLHISPDEQRKRLLARLDDPTKHWKYNPADVDERAFWPKYQEAYRDALIKCSTDLAPWYVVPADRKWYRDYAVARLLHETLESLRLRYPKPTYDIRKERTRLAE
jgi:PPK2 family polyphosphate:nucleotide phosphotransferase